LKSNILNKKKLVVISAVNLVEGGTLKIMLDCLDAAQKCLDSEWRIVALVHKKSLVEINRIECIEYPEVKRSWGARMRIEWLDSLKLSRQLKPDLWVSLHDITPRVSARRQVVYAHNPSPFFRISAQEAWLDPKFAYFTWFYRYLYGAFIHRNYYVIVQQEWIRKAFQQIYRHPSVLVAHPSLSNRTANPDTRFPFERKKVVFLYPALPRVFKNFEVICQAVKKLDPSLLNLIELRLTINGKENPYTRRLLAIYGTEQGIKFIGRQNRAEMDRQYAECDVLLFPSRLETWGLPITEAKAIGKPMLVADLPYAHETVGTYSGVSFISPSDPNAWANKIQEVIEGVIHYDGNVGVLPEAPFAADWPQLWTILIEGL
jgi:glycosyltransferase involved in cell wall biosynthesis